MIISTYPTLPQRHGPSFKTTLHRHHSGLLLLSLSNPYPRKRLTMPMPRMTPITSPSSSGSRSAKIAGMSLPLTKSVTEFKVPYQSDRTPLSPSYRSPGAGAGSRPSSRSAHRSIDSGHDSEITYHHNVSTLMAAKSRPFSVSGQIPLNSKDLTIFFRSQVSKFKFFSPV